MEIPVMTSASTHGIRSAVSACAKPATSYLSPSGYSGGYQKKIINANVHKTEAEELNKFNSFAKKRSCSLLCKKNKSSLGSKAESGLSQCFASSTKHKNGKLRGHSVHHLKYFAEEGPMKKHSKVLLNGFPKGLTLSTDLLSKIAANEIFDKKLGACLDEEESANAQKGRTKSGDVDNVVINGYSSVSGKDLTGAVAASCSGASRISDNNDRNNNSGSGEINGSDISDCRGNVNAKVNGNISIKRISNDGERCDDDGYVNGSDGEDKKESVGLLKWEPKHLVTRRSAQISREVLKVWQARFGSSSYVTAGQVPLLLKDLQLCSSKFQVHKTLERAGRGASPRISFEEFCRLLADSGYFKFFDAGIPRTTPTSRQIGKNGNHQQVRRTKKLSKTMCKYEVFLGGSCNPTTWRTEIAIPDLNKMGISYFNPVSQWRPDLLEVEYHAKENATIMFFVIDNQTRGVSALIEVAHIAGSRTKKLILVIQSYTQEKQKICGEIISQEEYEDLRNGQEVLQDLVEGQGTPVFDNISEALKCTEKILRENATFEEIGVGSAMRLCGEKRIELREAFDALVTSECGKIPLSDACLALQLFMDRRISSSDWKVIAHMFGIDNERKELEERNINYEEFVSLVTELRGPQDGEESFQGLGLFSNFSNDHSLPPVRDVFLGGTLKDASWKEEIAVPMLKKSGLTFFNPSVSEWSKRFSPIEAAAMKNSRVLLMVIMNSARSIAEMAVVAHYIGLGARMVLCIQEFSFDATIGSEKLSETAIKDYNRGRMYLTDIAKRSGVDVFSNVEDAVRHIVEECKKDR